MLTDYKIPVKEYNKIYKYKDLEIDIKKMWHNINWRNSEYNKKKDR